MPQPIIGTSEVEAQDAGNRMYARVTRRLLPIFFVCYVIAYLDRVNVGFAKLQMLHDLSFSEATYGLGAGIFFLGYCTFEVPSNLMLARIGARRWMARIMVTWGIVSACTLFVRTPWQFYTLRLLLGVAEAGMFPGIIYYLTRWYPSRRRGKVVGLLMTAQPISGLLGGPLSGWIMQRFQGVRYMAGWQWLFLLEALPAIVMGVALLFLIDDSIADARWLSDSEKRALQQAIDAETVFQERHDSFLSLLRSGRIWLLSAITFTSVMGLYGIGFWLPSIIKATGVARPLQIGLLTMVPYGAALLAILVSTRSSDRTGERRWHVAVATALGGVGLILSTLNAGNTALSLAALTIATMGIFASQPLFWNLPTAMLGGTAAAAGVALVNAGGNAAGFVSPYLVGWIAALTHSTTADMYVLAFFLFLSSALALCVPAALVNRTHPTHGTH